VAKFKCKVCHIKYKVSSHANASKEIHCQNEKCPLSCSKDEEAEVKIEQKQNDFKPNTEELLNFTSFIEKRNKGVEIIEDFQNPSPVYGSEVDMFDNRNWPTF